MVRISWYDGGGQYIFIIIIAPINVTNIIVIIIVVASVIITIATDGTLGIINTYSPVYTSFPLLFAILLPVVDW